MEEVRQLCQDSIFDDDIDVVSLPASVEEAYESILRKVGVKQRAYARLILLIIVGARRPLSVEEIACALSAARASGQQSSMLTRIEPSQLRQQIPTLCGPFVLIDHSQLFLIHQTAKTFLIAQKMETQRDPCLWKACLLESDIESEITTICVTYIHLLYMEHVNRIFETRIGKDIGTLPSKINSDGLWRYCAEYRTQHLREQTVQLQEDLLQQIMSPSRTDTNLCSLCF